MSKPLLLDLYCGRGGCARGYIEAGFEVVGVDHQIQPGYPGHFIQADALTFLRSADLHQFAALHASPVCKGFSLARHFHQSQQHYENHIPPVRALFKKSGKPYLIENVAGAPLKKSLMLCGMMFGLRVYRHRYFESNVLFSQPPHPKHQIKAARPGAIPREGEFWSVSGHFGHKDEAAAAMGIDWMTDREAIAQAIPPAYTKWIGRHLMEVLACF